jgi:Na+/proline symporter
MFLGLSLPDLLVLAGYFVIVAIIGLAASRLVGDREDFVMGGRRFGTLLTIMFAFGAGSHADQAVGVASKCYKERSLAGLWYQGVMIFTLPIYWLLAPIFRRARVMTTADFFERRFGRGFTLLYAAFAMFITIAFTSVGLFGTGKLVESLTVGEMPWKWSIPVIALVSIFYALAGGLIAAVWNDFFQGMLTVVMSLLILPFFWGHIGGLDGFRSALDDPGHAFRLVLDEGMTVFWIAMMSVNSLLSMVVQPQIMATTGATRTEMDSRVGFVGGMVLKRLMTIPWALTGVMALAMYGPGTIDPDLAFGKLARDLLPTGCAGLMLACVLASIMDNIALNLVSFAGIYTNSIHRRLFPSADERHLLAVTRAAGAVFAVIAIAAAYAFNDMPQAMRFMMKWIPLMGIAFFMAVLWPRANRYGAFASFAAAAASMLASERLVEGWKATISGFNEDTALPWSILAALAVGTAAGVVTSLLTPPESERRLRNFYLLLRTPLGAEQALRDAGLVEIPGTGTFEDPGLDAERTPATRLPAAWVTPSPAAIGGFFGVGVVALCILGFVRLLAAWLAGAA